MLRITPSANADVAKQYFGKGLVRSDYYIDGQEMPGIWGGKGATLLGLSGQVEQPEYFPLCDNLHPETAEQLPPRQKDARRVGFDFTFSAPKSVSVLYELSGDERILDAFRQSVKETMEDAEHEMKTRVRIKGADHDRDTGNMVWAEFPPPLHRPAEGEWTARSAPAFALLRLQHHARRCRGPLEGRAVRRLEARAPFTGEAAFDSRLAHRLNALGHSTVKGDYSFEVAGTPQSLTDKFSRRRNAIEHEAAKKGVSDAEGKHFIGYWGRENKTKGVGKAELREVWNARLSDEERTALLDAVHGRVTGDTIYTADEAKEYALAHSFQNASAVSEKMLRAEALKYGVGSVLPDSVADIAKHAEVIAVKRGGQLMATTKTVLQNEVAMLQFAKDGQRKFRPFVDAAEMPRDAFAGAFRGAAQGGTACGDEPRYGDRGGGQGRHRQDAHDARHD